jgi:hypothetical protein
VDGVQEYMSELPNMLILRGQIDALLRLTAYPAIDLSILWDSGCVNSNDGWSQVMERALENYLEITRTMLIMKNSRNGTGSIDT